MLFFPTKEEIQLVERKNIASHWRREIVEIKRSCQIQCITLLAPKAFP